MGKTLRTSWDVPRRVWRPNVALAKLAAAALLVLSVVHGAAQAAPNLLLNGDFSQDSLTPSGSGYTSFQLGTWQVNGSGTTYTGSLSNWTNASGAYNYVFTSGTATAEGQYGTLTLGDGSAIGTAPGGGNFLANDGDFDTGTVSQTITGLVVGAPTTVSFWWGAGVQNGYSLPNTESWTTSLCPTSGCVGTDTQSTAPYTLTTVDFSGWMQTTMRFIPTSTTEVLSFLAVGTGSPPFLLLADVSVQEPEPGTLAVMLTGLVGLGVLSRRRRRSAAQRTAVAS
jgi:hypothetical protein